VDMWQTLEVNIDLIALKTHLKFLDSGWLAS